MRSLQWRAALAGTAVLVAAVPVVASAYTAPLTCRDVTITQGWQRIPIQTFQPIQGVTSNDKPTSFSLAKNAPQRVTVTNGKQIKVSDKNGCSWSNGLTLGLQPTGAVPLTGTTSTIVSTATLPSGRVVAAVREGSGAVSRPHIVASDNGKTGYQVQDSGLPPQGAPRALTAADDGKTLYLALTPTDGKSSDGLPTLPDVDSPTSGAKTGLLYGSDDAGRTWTLRTSAGDLPGGGGGLDKLAVDRANPDKLYAISNGLLLVSTDGGANFSRARVNAEDVTAVETGPGGYVIAFTASGKGLASNDGHTFPLSIPAPPGVTSAAYRGEFEIAVESPAGLARLQLRDGAKTSVTGVTPTRGSLIGDTGDQATYHGLSGHSLLRFSDPKPKGDPIPAIDDLGVPPPPPGTITPAERTVKLKVGDSTVVDYQLAVPKSPTPLDLMFLVDTSGSMESLISDLKKNISIVTETIQHAGIDLRVGIATVGVGSEQPGLPEPDLGAGSNATGDHKLYELLAPVGPVRNFAPALAKVQVRNSSPGQGSEEAQLIGLEQATAGLGVHDPSVPAAVNLYSVPPGQDAHWRQAPDIRRLIVHATDEAFAKPAGTRLKNGQPDIGHAVALMNQYHVQQFGLSLLSPEAQADLAKVARGTHTLAPPGGADCGDDIVLRAGAPLVCDTGDQFSEVIARLVRDLTDRQTIGLTASGASPKVIRALDATHLRRIDVTVPNRLSFKVAVTCKGQSAGRYSEHVGASLRNVQIATTNLTVECVSPPAAVAFVPPAAASVAVAAAPPVVQAPAAIVPAPPAAQPQFQPQSQPQVNPMTAAALQQQEELQLALALQATEPVEEQGEELAMVGHRHRDQGAALVLLATAMAASAGFGLARLRSRPEPSVARVRR